MTPITFVSELGQSEQKHWLQALKKHLPNEDIVPFAELRERNRETVEIAILAEPDIGVIPRLGNLKWVQNLSPDVERLVNSVVFMQIPIVRLIDPQRVQTMSESVLAWTLYLHRNMHDYAVQQQNRHWNALPYVQAAERAIGVLGADELMVPAIQKLVLADFKVLGWSHTQQNQANIEGVEFFYGKDELSKFLKKVDIAISLLPLTKETNGIINHQVLQSMKKGSSIINFGRCEVFKIYDLLKALEVRHISHAVLDRFMEEPLPANSVFWESEHITLLPHIAAQPNLEEIAKAVAANVTFFRTKNEIPVSVNRAKGY